MSRPLQIKHGCGSTNQNQDRRYPCNVGKCFVACMIFLSFFSMLYLLLQISIFSFSVAEMARRLKTSTERITNLEQEKRRLEEQLLKPESTSDEQALLARLQDKERYGNLLHYFKLITISYEHSELTRVKTIPSHHFLWTLSPFFMNSHHFWSLTIFYEHYYLWSLTIFYEH